LQLTGAHSVDLVVSIDGQDHCVASIGTPYPAANRVLVAEVQVPVVEGKIGLQLFAATTLATNHSTTNHSATLEVIAAMLGRLLQERRASRPQNDAPWGFVVVRHNGDLRVVSPTVCAMMDFELDRTLGRSVFELVHPDDHALAIDSLARTATFPGEKYPLDLRFLRADGTSRLLEITGEDRVDTSLDDVVFGVRSIEQRGEDDALVGDQLRVLDMIGRGERLDTTLREIARLASLRLGAGCAVLLTAENKLTLVVQASEGLSAAMLEVLNGTVVGARSNTCGATTFRGQAVGSRDLLTDESWRRHWALLEAEGIRSCWADPILANRASRALGAVAVFATEHWAPLAEDVRIADVFASLASVAVQRTQAESFLHHQATHDDLTGLPNRALFLERLEGALAQRDLRASTVGVLFLDLDRFKIVNDALGHEAGDELLMAVAARLKLVTQAEALVARFGGDEFTILAESIESPRDAIHIGERIVEAFRRPLRLAVGELVMTVSVGVALSPKDHVSASAMLRDADAAMYRAKHRGRNRVDIFDSAMRAQALDRLELVHSLQEAIHGDELALFYQPEVDLANKTVIGAEALLRWRHPTRGFVPPSDFIPLAEETGAILGLGDWVIEEACRQITMWDHAFAPRLERTWVNISAIQLLNPGFSERVSAVLNSASVEPHRVGLEITESALMTDIDAAIVALSDLRDLGLATAIDDFGTGQASLSYIRRLPVDLVKIDQSFVQNIGTDPRGLGIVGAIVDLVHATGCRVLAEGVETEEQFLGLQQVGCDEAQGYWIGRPQPAEEQPPLAKFVNVAVYED
jgi:diguanylate cyclase (GGDEF)-like protein